MLSPKQWRSNAGQDRTAAPVMATAAVVLVRLGTLGHHGPQSAGVFWRAEA